ncbi:hypothetical protein BJ165DRAFT_1526533 [Panaeolus papilionaceus]|nr:hypothetical protein BJ165DRAFT_1526533 [Panaeolus papilionaceus]
MSFTFFALQYLIAFHFLQPLRPQLFLRTIRLVTIFSPVSATVFSARALNQPTRITLKLGSMHLLSFTLYYVFHVSFLMNLDTTRLLSAVPPLLCDVQPPYPSHVTSVDHGSLIH